MLETSSIYIIRALTPLEHVWQARHHVSKYKQIFTSIHELEKREATSFPAALFSLPSGEKLCGREGWSEVWINLIRCALLSNSSHTESKQKRGSNTLCMAWRCLSRKFRTTPHKHTQRTWELANWIHFQFNDFDIIWEISQFYNHHPESVCLIDCLP